MYLSKITIAHFRGIEFLEVSFAPKINIIIGENGQCKSALIDAIRLLYSLGEPVRDLAVVNEDFFEEVIKANGGISIHKKDHLTISYEFKGLTPEQKGAFYEYMVVDGQNPGEDYARMEIRYRQDKRYPVFSYSTGKGDGQKADTSTFRLFQHYYLSAIRDSTKDLLTNRNNILGKVIKRLVERQDTEDQIKDIIREANAKLLARGEVISTRESINSNLKNIYKNVNQSQIGLQIEQSRIDYIVNVIKPFLPHDWNTHSIEGFNLWQNSLGFNNLIYIATVLGDIKERIKDDPISHFALLIEEPEAHIHPQLQLSLYNFLKEANEVAKSQLFITSHSPTLTSKVPFENLILLDKLSYVVSETFADRECENIVQDTAKNKPLLQSDIDEKKAQLQRYLDVTKSQLFFARACLLVEGISEELLISALCQVEGFQLEDYRIELINVDGISFYPFVFLFNSSVQSKRLPKRIAILSDDDRFTDSGKKEYNSDKLVENNYQQLIALHNAFKTATVKARVNNLHSVKNNQSSISVQFAFQTMEYDLCLNNVHQTKNECLDNFLFQYIEAKNPSGIQYAKTFLQHKQETLSDDDREQLAILLWKALPSKAIFAQEFAMHLLANLNDAKKRFQVPVYIKTAFDHLKQ